MEYTITQIAQAKKNLDRVNIFINGNFWIGLDKNNLLNFDLYKNKVIDESLKVQIEKISETSKIIDKVHRYIGLRPRSIKEINDYLHYKQELSKEESQAIVSKLIEKKILSDEEFTKWYIENRLNFGIHGGNKIKGELIKKGVEKKIIDQFLREMLTDNEENNQDEKMKLLVIKAKKTIKFKNSSELKQKLLQRLIGRGFSYTESINVINSMV